MKEQTGGIVPIKESRLIPKQGEEIISEPTSIDFKKVFDDYLLNERWIRKRKITEFYPSDLTFPCLRNIYFKYTHPNVSDSVDTMRVFKIGTLIHEFIQKVFKSETEAFTVIDIESPVRRFYTVDGDKIQLRGRADIILEVDGELSVVELKSMRPQYFINYKPRPKIMRDQPFKWLKEVKIEHKKQCQWYMKNLRIKHGYVIYYEKVGLLDKIFKVDLDDYKTSESVVPIAKKLYRALRDKKIPPPERKHWNGLICNYCKYNPEICKEEAEN